MLDIRGEEQVFIPYNEQSELGDIAVEWVGHILIESEGYYSFATESDDGSALYLNNELIVDNWGSHARSVVRATRYLTPGIYPIAVRYYNLGFGGMMALLWTEPIGHLKPIPARNLIIANPQ